MDDEFEGRCLSSCFPAILDAAAQWYGLADSNNRWFRFFPELGIAPPRGEEYARVPPNINGPV